MMRTHSATHQVRASTAPSDSAPYQLKSDAYSSHSVILREIRIAHGRRVLDVGTASGYLAKLLSERGFQVSGIEADPVLAHEAASYCRELFISDLDGPLPDLQGQFDAIIYADVLEHLKNPQRVLASINEYLARDGIVIISVPNVAHAWVRLQVLVGHFDYADRGILDRTHLRFFTLKSFRSFLAEAGLDLVKLIATPVPLPLVVPGRFQGRAFGFIHALNARIANAWKTMFGYQFVAVAHKRTVP
jgi:2-polyprenyl-3-methyl-5-hydroxy-6-metoxy-1,4-benzoquinol methylase